MPTNRVADFIVWVRGCLTATDEEECRMIECLHYPDNRTVQVWKVKHDDSPEILAKEAFKVIETHARQLGEVQRYIVQAFFGEAEHHGREYPMHFNFRLVDDNPDHLSNEPPTEKGVLAQTQRLLEATFRTSIGATSKVLDAYEDQARSDKEEISNLRKENKDLRTENQQMLNDQFKEALILRKVAFKEAQLEKLWGMIIPLAPTIITSGLRAVTGGKVNMALPGAPTSMEQKMMGFAGSLKPDQFHELMSKLEPAQQMLLVDMMKDMQQKHEAMQASIAKRGGGPEHPVAPPNAAGDGKTPPTQSAQGGQGAQGGAPGGTPS